MNAESEIELKALEKENIRVTLINAPATIVFSVGIAATVVPATHALHPLLGNAMLTTSMMIIGGAVMVWSFLRFTAIHRRRVELLRG